MLICAPALMHPSEARIVTARHDRIGFRSGPAAFELVILDQALSHSSSRAGGCRHQGFRSGGTGGASRIKVMVTRRLAAIKGSSGNNGSVSALPATSKIL